MCLNFDYKVATLYQIHRKKTINCKNFPGRSIPQNYKRSGVTKLFDFIFKIYAIILLT